MSEEDTGNDTNFAQRLSSRRRGDINSDRSMQTPGCIGPLQSIRFLRGRKLLVSFFVEKMSDRTQNLSRAFLRDRRDAYAVYIMRPRVFVP